MTSLQVLIRHCIYSWPGTNWASSVDHLKLPAPNRRLIIIYTLEVWLTWSSCGYLYCMPEILWFFVGLPSHPNHELAKKQMSGFGGMVTFLIRGNLETAKKFLQFTKVLDELLVCWAVSSCYSYNYGTMVVNHGFICAGMCAWQPVPNLTDWTLVTFSFRPTVQKLYILG